MGANLRINAVEGWLTFRRCKQKSDYRWTGESISGPEFAGNIFLFSTCVWLQKTEFIRFLLEYVSAQIFIFGDIRKLLSDIGRVDCDLILGYIGSCK